MGRRQIEPNLMLPFDQVFQIISRQPDGRTPQLQTTGGVNFLAEAKVTRDGRPYIALPHSNRIYASDWGYQSNAMGRDGQRIGQYSVPLDFWAGLQ